MVSQSKVLEALFEKGPQHIRKLGRNANVNPNTVINVIRHLEKKKLVSRRRDDSNRVVIQPANSLLFKQKKVNYNLEKIIASGLVDFLNEELAFPTIILFGSFAKGENHEGSDIDLFIIADEKKQLKLSKYEKILGTNIQLFLHTKKEFKSLLKKNQELMNNVINGIKLTGYFEVL